MLATSYGYYWQTLLDFQGYHVLAILRSIRDRGWKAQLPLISFVESIASRPGTVDIMASLAAWHRAEMMMLHLEGIPTDYDMHASAGRDLYPFVLDNFARLNYALTYYLNDTGQTNLPVDFTPTYFSQSREELRKSDDMMTGLKLGGELDVRTVLENAAKASEYWGASGPISTARPKHSSPAISKYWLLLERVASALDTEDIRTIALTYGVIADLALNPPILPHHRQVRTPELRFSDLHPLARTLDAIGRASQLRPVRDLDTDYVRFATDLCDLCNWSPPTELGRFVLETATGDPPDYVTDLYLRSLRLRDASPATFNDLEAWRSPKQGRDDELTYFFVPPVMQFSDKVFFHSDKNLARRFIEGYLFRHYLRNVMISADVSVDLPYQAEPAEVAMWTGWLESELLFHGFIRPRVLVRSPLGSQAHAR